MIDLIIFDIFGTLVARGGGNATPRKGMLDFLEKNKEKSMVAATDADYDSANGFLSALGIRDSIKKVYGYDDMVKVPNVHQYSYRKDLVRICGEQGAEIDQTVLISDGNNDRLQAKRVGMRFIHVPYYLTSEEPFSFDLVDLSRKLPKYWDLRDVNPPIDFIP